MLSFFPPPRDRRPRGPGASRRRHRRHLPASADPGGGARHHRRRRAVSAAGSIETQLPGLNGVFSPRDAAMLLLTPRSCWASASSRASYPFAARSGWSRQSRCGWTSGRPHRPLRFPAGITSPGRLGSSGEGRRFRLACRVEGVAYEPAFVSYGPSDELDRHRQTLGAEPHRNDNPRKADGAESRQRRRIRAAAGADVRGIVDFSTGSLIPAAKPAW